MAKLSFYGLRVWYLVFLFCIPDYAAHARVAKAYDTAYGNGHQGHVQETRQQEERELKMEVSQLLQRLQYKRWEKEQAQQKLAREEKRSGIAPVAPEDKQVDRSSRSWAAALTLISGSAQAACVGVILANMGCGGLQKDLCDLRMEVAQLREDLSEETKIVMTTEDRYESLRDLCINADADNDNIVRKLEDSIDMSQKYLALLASVQAYVGTLPVVTPSFFSLDSDINKYLIDLDKLYTIPNTASTSSDAILWGATLALEIGPYLFNALQKKMYAGKVPTPDKFSSTVMKEGKMYGVQGLHMWEMNTKTGKAVGKEVSISKLSGSYNQAIRSPISLKPTVKTSTWSKFTGKLSMIANSAIVKCMTYVFQVAAIALCTWQVYDIISKNAEAKTKLTEQKVDMKTYLADVQTSKEDMDLVVETIESQVTNHSENFMILNDVLLSSRSFYGVGSESDRQPLIDMNTTETTESNLRANQAVMLTFVTDYYTDLKNEYDRLRKYDQITLDVMTDTAVSSILHKLEALSIPVDGLLEIYQIIAAAYPDTVRYDGVNLACIRDNTISTEAELTEALTGSVLAQNVVSQITSMALGMSPVVTIIYVVNMRYAITPTEAQVLESIAKDAYFTSQDNYADYTGATHDLTVYRTASCT